MTTPSNPAVSALVVRLMLLAQDLEKADDDAEASNPSGPLRQQVRDIEAELARGAGAWDSIPGFTDLQRPGGAFGAWILAVSDDFSNIEAFGPGFAGLLQDVNEALTESALQSPGFRAALAQLREGVPEDTRTPEARLLARLVAWPTEGPRWWARRHAAALEQEWPSAPPARGPRM